MNMDKVVAALRHEQNKLESELKHVQNAISALSSTSTRKTSSHVMSAAARKRISEAQRSRWAKVRKDAAKLDAGAKVVPMRRRRKKAA
jgi:hypothetical protein